MQRTTGSDASTMPALATNSESGAPRGHLVVWILLHEPDDDVRGDETCDCPTISCQVQGERLARGSAVFAQRLDRRRCMRTCLPLQL